MLGVVKQILWIVVVRCWYLTYTDPEAMYNRLSKQIFTVSLSEIVTLVETKDFLGSLHSDGYIHEMTWGWIVTPKW